MGRLLFELLSEVFDKYLEDEHWSQMLEDAPRPLVPRTCHSDPGQICSFRRAVALGYPQLWQNIVILNPKKSQIYLTEQWLKRAGTALLDLTVYMPNEDSTYDAVQYVLFYAPSRARNTGEKLACNCHLILWLDTCSYSRLRQKRVRTWNPPNSCLQWMTPIRYLWELFYDMYRKIWRFLFDLAPCAELVVQVDVHKRLSWQIHDATNWLRSLVTRTFSSTSS